MFNYYYLAIISQIERITNEYYVAFVIICWYIGTVIGCFIAIHLHTINRTRSKLVLFIGGVLFILWLLIGGSLMNLLCYRILMGTFIGIIYLSAIVIIWLQINLSTFTCSFTMAVIIAIKTISIAPDIVYAMIVLTYSLIVLNVSSILWNSATTTTINIIKHQNIPSVRKLRPLIYLIGAKLLTIFCYYLPFGYCITAMRCNHLIILLLTRLALGTIIICIIFYRDNVNYLTVIYLCLLASLFTIVLLIAFVDDLKQIQWILCITVYCAFSFIVDVIEHRAVLLTEQFSIENRIISITFADVVEHLIDILVIVIYLNDWNSAKLILTSLTVTGFTLAVQQVIRTSFATLNCDRIELIL